MGRSGRVVVGGITVLPLLYILGLLLVFRDFKYETIEKLHYVMMAVYLGVIVWYERDVRSNDCLPNEKRALWSALVLVGSSVAQVVYFYHYVWRDADELPRRRFDA